MPTALVKNMLSRKCKGKHFRQNQMCLVNGSLDYIVRLHWSPCRTVTARGEEQSARNGIVIFSHLQLSIRTSASLLRSSNRHLYISTAVLQCNTAIIHQSGETAWNTRWQCASNTVMFRLPYWNTRFDFNYSNQTLTISEFFFKHQHQNINQTHEKREHWLHK